MLRWNTVLKYKTKRIPTFNGTVLPINVRVLAMHLSLDYLQICLFKSEIHLHDNGNVKTNILYLLSNLSPASN